MQSPDPKTTPSPEEMSRCKRLCIASKSGEKLMADEFKFLTEFHAKWPDHYPSSKEIFEETHPLKGMRS